MLYIHVQTSIETLILCLYLKECNINIIAMSSNEPVIPHKWC